MEMIGGRIENDTTPTGHGPWVRTVRHATFGRRSGFQTDVLNAGIADKLLPLAPITADSAAHFLGLVSSPRELTEWWL